MTFWPGPEPAPTDLPVRPRGGYLKTIGGIFIGTSVNEVTKIATVSSVRMILAAPSV